jgi:hypothetical protein
LVTLLIQITYTRAVFVNTRHRAALPTIYNNFKHFQWISCTSKYLKEFNVPTFVAIILVLTSCGNRQTQFMTQKS